MRTKPILISVVLCLLGFMTLQAEPRVALVIGNGAYRYTTTLKNPINDAADMAEALRAAGFEVILETDAGLDAMYTAVREFGNKLKEKRGTGLFFYSGH
ncbi:MAG TPA: caspase family protein, partial [Spirochaetia bacterium]|nr:caspase family protein [Spirochaetia bacterium]